MIQVDLFFSIGAYLFLVILLVIGAWIFYTEGVEDSMQVDSDRLCQCPYCTYLFFDYGNSTLKNCPRCESYFGLEGVEK